jgi:hypothetical protein
VHHTDASPFILPRPAGFKNLIPPRLLELLLTSF